MISDKGMRSMLHSNGGEELGLMMKREQRRQESSDREKELNIYRSGSAPPTVEGSLNAVGGLFGGSADFGGISEEEMRSDPAYVNYYYLNVNLNPRLPPPLQSKEDWRFSQRLHGSGGSSALGGIGDRRMPNRVGDESLFSLQPAFNNELNDELKSSAEWGGDGLIGLPGLGLGSRQKSIAEIIQDDLNHGNAGSMHPSRPASRNAFDDNVESSEPQISLLPHDLASSMDALLSSGTNPGVPASQNIGASHSYASALGSSLSRGTTPDPQLIARAPSPRIPTVGLGRTVSIDKRSINGDKSDLVAAFSGMTLSTNGVVNEEKHSLGRMQNEFIEHQNLFYSQGEQYHVKPHTYLNKSEMSSANSYYNGPLTPTFNNRGNSPPNYQNLGSPNSSLSKYGLGGYAMNPASPSMMGNHGGHLPPLFENIAAASALGVSAMDSRALGGGLGLGLGPNLVAELQNARRMGNHNLQMPLVDPVYLQYIRSTEYATALNAALNDPNLDRNSYMELVALHKANLGALFSHQKSQYGLPYLGETGGGLNPNSHGYYGNAAFGHGMSYPGSPMAGSLHPNLPFGSNSPVKHGERNMRFPSGMRNLGAGIMGSWHSEVGGTLDENFAPSLLDEFKSSKARCFELSEITGHVVEFSADQYGSRFIQQKLETATEDEKIMVFLEIMPQAFSLMTDVFGNYVIQKFFEHGTTSQIRELADQLTGHVLTLSLQMYGCRVIQKAIEVVELDQQSKMVAELDGHVMRCVRDQNGNHVIQKCIECIPQDSIHFIISVFYDQVVTLSTHPYGCRVIQRVLEHCSDAKTQQIVMDEILQSVCMLAQDQYGNYVVQHVLEHGKPHERSAIINKLIGQIVQMSQQKFASNVVEKCLTFGTPEERQYLVTEMLGTTDENEPLQAMMKDQFANYVVQKVLETCDDQQLELILNRIKVHLNALKKYTYGKHIVARVEKLVAAGERRIGVISSYSG